LVGLKRSLGPGIAIAVVVGNVIGSGIFLKPGTIAADGGRFDLIILVWVFGGLLCLLGALCFAELAAMYPQAGGIYVYLREAYGKLFAFLFGWTEVIFGKPAAIGALAVAFAGKFALAFNRELSAWEQVAMASVLIGSLAWVNIMGVLWGGRMQVLTTVIKAGFLGVLAVLPFALAGFTERSLDTTNYGTVVTANESSMAVQIGAVLLAVMWAYNGWHGLTSLAEEVREPQRNIPLSLFAGIGILIALYVSANVAYHGVLSMQEMKAAGPDAAEHMLDRLLGRWGVLAMSAVIMCSTFGAINVNLLNAPRIIFAMGRDRLLFRGLGKVHAGYHTPVAAIVVMALMSTSLIVVVMIAKHLAQDADPGALQSEIARRIVGSLQDDSIFDLLTNFVIFSASIFYALTVLAVLVLRFRQPQTNRPYRTWGYPLTPVLFLGVYTWFLVQVYSSRELESRVGLLLIGMGIPVFFIGHWWKNRR
jgi:APA family basic amino acid/polyamine antiporter